MERVLRSAGVGAAALLNARFPRTRNRVLGVPSFFGGWVATEAAGWFAAQRVLAVGRNAAQQAYRTRQGRLALAVDLVTVGGFVALVQQGRRAGGELEAALTPLVAAETLNDRPQANRMAAVFPFMTGSSQTHRTRNVSYADDNRWRHKLDIYRPKQGSESTTAHRGERRPAIMEIHGGAWIIGDKNQQGIPLLNHMVRNGWVGFNINYRLAPKVSMLDQIIDCKRAIAWVRSNADELGVDPDFITITGGSAGGHLTSLLALTANDPEFQPGFEDVDTTVQAAVPFYGVYDLLDESALMVPGFVDFLERSVVKLSATTEADAWRRYSPLRRVHGDAPPMMMLHGTADALVPVAQGREFAAALNAVSDHAVVFAELAGANHAFDIFSSPRAVRTTEYVERFLTGVHNGSIK